MQRKTKKRSAIRKFFFEGVMLLLLDSHSSLLTYINIYTRPIFVPSLYTIRSKLRPLERIVVFSLVEYIATPFDSTQLIFELNLYLYKTYTFLPSLLIIGSKLRSLSCTKAFPLVLPVLFKPQNLYLNKTYSCTEFCDNQIKITTSRVFQSFLEESPTSSICATQPIFGYNLYFNQFTCRYINVKKDLQ